MLAQCFEINIIINQSESKPIMKTQNNYQNMYTNISPKNPDPSKVDPTKQDERDNDPTRIKPNVNEPGKVDPTQPPATPSPQPQPGKGEQHGNIGFMKFNSIVLMFCLSVFTMSVSAESSNVANKENVSTTKTLQKAEAQKLIRRLHEIREVASSHKLKISEKKELRSEVKAIQDKLQKMTGFYIYLSAGAIIAILLLIILL